MKTAVIDGMRRVDGWTRRKAGIYIIIVYAILVFALCLPAYAAAGGRLTVESASAVPGETVDVVLRVTENPGIVATLLQVRYDASVLTLESVEDGEIFAAGAAEFGNDLTKLPFTLLWEDSLSRENYTGTGVLATLHFAVQPDAPSGDTKVAVEIDPNSTFDTDLQKVPFTAQSGTVRIGEGAGRGVTMQLLLSAGVLCLVFLIAAAAEIVRRKKKRAKPTTE